jgi:hypothetical protein
MYRFHSITNLAPLFSAMPLSAWLMLVASTLLGVMLERPAPVPISAKN